MPPCTLPPKFTSVGWARKRNVTSCCCPGMNRGRGRKAGIPIMPGLPDRIRLSAPRHARMSSARGFSGRLQRIVAVDRHMRHTVLTDPAAVHALGVERHRHAAIGAEDDRAAVTAELRNFVIDDRLSGLLRGFLQTEE